MFAVLGEISFEVLGSPESLIEARDYHYAEHQVVEARPLLQWISSGLATLTLELLLHVSFVDPVATLAALEAAAADHTPRPLVFGNGTHRGYFVVTAISTVARQMSDEGDPIALVVRIKLREWVQDAELDPNAPPVPAFTPLGLITPAPGLATPTSADALAPALDFFPTPGLSALAFNPAPTGRPAPALSPGDISPDTIVRSAR